MKLAERMNELHVSRRQHQLVIHGGASGPRVGSVIGVAGLPETVSRRPQSDKTFQAVAALRNGQAENRSRLATSISPPRTGRLRQSVTDLNPGHNAKAI